MINALELDSLTEQVQNRIFDALKTLEGPTTLQQKYAVALEIQQVLKELYVKGYNTGVGEKILKDKNDD